MASSSQSQEAPKFEVKIRIEDREPFRPGMSVTAEIETRSRKGVLAVPIQSVTSRLPAAGTPKPADAKPGDPDPVQPVQHLARNVAFDHGALKGVAVDQHRRLERLEAGDTHCVEDARPGMAEVDLTGGDGSYDLLLGIGGEAAPFVDDLDTDVAA